MLIAWCVTADMCVGRCMRVVVVATLALLVVAGCILVAVCGVGGVVRGVDSVVR